jgi:hypothetical protein
MAVNNNGNLLDSSSNVAVDFVWGNVPMQPNDDRAASISNFGGTTGSDEIQYQTAVVTAASASAGTVTYTAANTFIAGQTVTITGLSTSAFNLTDVLIATVSSSQFTVTNAATGTAVTGATAQAKVVISSLPGVGADYAWAATTQVASGRLNPALDSHNIAEGEWASYPSFTAATGNYIITAASGDGTTVTYTAQNKLAAGDVVNITGLTTSAFNLSSATVATANATKFTVTSAVGSGVSITGQYGKVESTTAAASGDGAFISGTAYIVVPSVLGETTANALDELLDAGYESANITTAAGATNTRTDVTRFNATSTTVAAIYATSAHTNYPTGTKVTLVAGTPAGVSPVNLPAYALGTWTVTGSAGSGQITVSGSGFTVADTTGINATGTLGGANGTIKTQSTAANAASIATTATITITPWANAS